MNSACKRCNLRTLNQHEHLMDGPYKKQFEIPVIPSNKDFVTHPYNQHKCDVSELVCFSLTGGAKKCHVDTSLQLGYDVQGNLLKSRKITHLN